MLPLLKASGRFIIAPSLLHLCEVWNNNKTFFFCCTFRWNDLCDYVKCCVGRLYRFSLRQCYESCNKSTRAVVFPPPSVTFWLKCKCKFAHETDGSCNTQQTSFPGFEGKGNRNPFTITYRSTFLPVVLFSSFLHSRKREKKTASSGEISAISPEP